MADEGQSGSKFITRLEKGDNTRTARHASVMNEIIDGINSLLGMKVTRSGEGDGKLLTSDSNTVLDLGSVGSGAIDVAGGNTLAEAEDGDHEVDDVGRITVIGWGDPAPVIQDPDDPAGAVIDIFPSRDDLDTSKKYACVFVHFDDGWQLELQEVCDS